MEFSTFCSNTVVVDKSLWHIWLMGLTVDNAITVTLAQHRKRAAALGTHRPEQNQVAHYVTTQFRNFETIEHFLHHPKQLHTQPIFPLPHTTKRFLIESYYGFDERVFREILGKKLTSRVRKELDDVSQKTRLPIAGCRRMFDNLKRIIKRVEDSDGDMVAVIQRDFLLPLILAMQYANTIFINTHRIDTTKKRLAHLRFADFEFAASVLIRFLTASPETVLEELDASIAQDARDLKSILFNSKDALEGLRSAMVSHLVGIGQPHVMERAGASALKITLRNVMSIGSGVANSKDVRELFGAIQEKIVDPCAAYGWSSTDLDLFFSTIVALFSGPDIDAFLFSNNANPSVSTIQQQLQQMQLVSHQQQSLVLPAHAYMSTTSATSTSVDGGTPYQTNASTSVVSGMPGSLAGTSSASGFTQQPQQTEPQQIDQQQQQTAPSPLQSRPYHHHQSVSSSSAAAAAVSSSAAAVLTQTLAQSPIAVTPTPQPFTGISASIRRRYGTNFARLVTAIRLIAVRFLDTTSGTQ